MQGDFKAIPTKPLTGLLDFRTPLNEMGPDSVRYRENFSSDDAGACNRSRGFKRFMGGNADLHDQLLPLQTYYDYKFPRVDGGSDITLYPNSTMCGNDLHTRANGREIPNFGFMAVTSTGGRRLLVGTRSRLYCLNETTQNWRILADGMGGTGMIAPRFYAATQGSTVVLTNGVDLPVFWPIDGPPTGCEQQSVLPITDLSLIGVTRAGCVVQFEDCIIFGDVTQDGVRYTNRIRWSDRGIPTAFDTANPASATGFFDLPSGVTILWLGVMNGILIALCDKGIYPINFTASIPLFTGGTAAYGSDVGAKCLAYRNTACVFGGYLFFAAKDGFYTWNQYQLEPERADWMHAADGVMYEGQPGYGKINMDQCDLHNAVFKPAQDDDAAKRGEGEIWLSWAEEGFDYCTRTIILNTKFNFAYTKKAGFNMMVNYVSDPRVSVRDFLLSTCACSFDKLADLGLPFLKEGLPDSAALCPPPGGPVSSIYTKSVASYFGSQTEDWSLPQADPDSLCALLKGETLDDICRGCYNQQYLIGAWTGDWCLKSLNETQAESVCTNPTTSTGPGTPYQNLNGKYQSFPGAYTLQGYFSIVRGAPGLFGSHFKKEIKRFLVECWAQTQTLPCVLQLRIGQSYHAADPNGAGTGDVIWRMTLKKFLAETDTMTPAQYAAANLVPNIGMEFPLYESGQWLYWELTIGSLADPEDINSLLIPAQGGASKFGGIWQTVRLINNYAD